MEILGICEWTENDGDRNVDSSLVGEILILLSLKILSFF